MRRKQHTRASSGDKREASTIGHQVEEISAQHSSIEATCKEVLGT
jgi:hypothetical protein